MLERNLLVAIIFGNNWKIIRHSFMIVILFFTIFPSNIEESKLIKYIPESDRLVRIAYENALIEFGIALVLLYINLFWLVKIFLFQKKYIQYIVSCFIMSLIYFVVNTMLAQYKLRDFTGYIHVPNLTSVATFIDMSIVPLVFLSAITGYIIFKKWLTDSERYNELVRINMQEELDKLKSQVNPHFLFNTLNNLDYLVQSDAQKASLVIQGLSEVLRYHLYYANKDKILLSKDIEVLDQYLLLEKFRRDHFNYEILIEKLRDGILIPPQLFVNFIDNAINHSRDSRNLSYVKVRYTNDGEQLNFYCENSKPSFIQKKENGGIGLMNIQRRLELLYKNNYTLKISDEPNKYIVNLRIPL